MKWFKFVIFIAAIINVDCKPDTENFVALDDGSIRLPNHTRPINYDIELSVNIHNGTRSYSGRANINIAVDIATDVIALHNKGLNIGQVRVIDTNDEELTSTIEHDAARDFLIVKVERLLTVGDEYSVEILFNGMISQSTSGFYRMSYRNIESKEIR